jgi:hypothetical protein
MKRFRNIPQMHRMTSVLKSKDGPRSPLDIFKIGHRDNLPLRFSKKGVTSPKPGKLQKSQLPAIPREKYSDLRRTRWTLSDSPQSGPNPNFLSPGNPIAGADQYFPFLAQSRTRPCPRPGIFPGNFSNFT